MVTQLEPVSSDSPAAGCESVAKFFARGVGGSDVSSFQVMSLTKRSYSPSTSLCHGLEGGHSAGEPAPTTSTREKEPEQSNSLTLTSPIVIA